MKITELSDIPSAYAVYLCRAVEFNSIGNGRKSKAANGYIQPLNLYMTILFSVYLSIFFRPQSITAALFFPWTFFLEFMTCRNPN